MIIVFLYIFLASHVRFLKTQNLGRALTRCFSVKKKKKIQQYKVIGTYDSDKITVF